MRWDWDFFVSGFIFQAISSYMDGARALVCVGYGRFGVVQNRAEQSAAN